MNEWVKYLGKYVYVELKNHRRYHGKIVNVQSMEETDTYFLITVKDKNGNRIMFNSIQVLLIQGEPHGS
jgi:small nuclear ribonucleoprotein (snRNP)-like protein